jgi:hypothetical protein
MLPKFRSVQDTKGDEERQCFSGESLNSQARHDKTQVLPVKLDRHEDATSDDENPDWLAEMQGNNYRESKIFQREYRY